MTRQSGLHADGQMENGLCAKVAVGVNTVGWAAKPNVSETDTKSWDPLRSSQATKKLDGSFHQHSIIFTAKPPRAVSLYLLFISAPV